MNTIKTAKILVMILVIAVFHYSASPIWAYNPQAVQIYNDAVDISKTGNFEEAINLFKKALVIEPEFVDAYYNLASLYEYMGNETQALTYYEIVLSKAPTDSEVAYKVASIYFKKHDYTKAQNYLRNISATDPKFKEVQVLRSKIAIEINKKKQAAVAAAVKPVDLTAINSKEKIILGDLQGPTGITKDSAGNMYVANYSTNTIIKVSPAGNRTVLAKGGLINGPIGLVANSYGNIYVASYLSNQIVKITPDGKTSTLLKGINKPYYLYLDKAGMLYVSEQGSNSIIKIKAL